MPSSLVQVVGLCTVGGGREEMKSAEVQAQRPGITVCRVRHHPVGTEGCISRTPIDISVICDMIKIPGFHGPRTHLCCLSFGMSRGCRYRGKFGTFRLACAPRVQLRCRGFIPLPWLRWICWMSCFDPHNRCASERPLKDFT